MYLYIQTEGDWRHLDSNLFLMIFGQTVIKEENVKQIYCIYKIFNELH